MDLAIATPPPPTSGGDVRDLGILRGALRDQDFVFHLVAMVGVSQSMYQIDRYVQVNTMGTARHLEYGPRGGAMVEAFMGLPLPVDKPRRRCPDITRARSVLRQAPSTLLLKGLGGPWQATSEGGDNGPPCPVSSSVLSPENGRAMLIWPRVWLGCA